MPNSQRVYIGNIPSDARERDLEKFFKGYGRINDLVIKNGYGFVEFSDYRDADDAVADLDGKDMEGGRVRVELAREDPKRGGRRGSRDRGGFTRDGGRRGNPPGPRTNYRLIVENMSSRTSWQDLKDYFRTAGEITYTNVNSPRSGEGIVEFSNRRGLEYAIKYRDELELDGKRLRVREESTGGSSIGRGGFRRGGRSRSRSGSRSRSRSKSESRSKSRSRSKDKKGRGRDRSRSRSGSRSRSRSHSHTHSRSRSNDRGHEKNGDRSRSQSRSNSRSKSKSISRSKSRSKS